jgi:hypothetical protein
MAKLFDTQDHALQIDLIRAHLRRMLGGVGAVPDDLKADHDIGWPAVEQKRLDDEAKAAEAHAAALKEAAAKAKPAA